MSSHRLTRTLAACIGVLLAASAGTAAAGSITISDLVPRLAVDVAAGIDNQRVHNGDWTDQDSTIYGTARASTLGTSSSVSAPGDWPQSCTGDPGCQVDSLTSLYARGQAQANGDLGRLRAHSHTNAGDSGGTAGGNATISDIVTFGPLVTPRLQLHLHGLSRAQTERAYTSMALTIGLGRHYCDTDIFADGCFYPVFRFEARDYDNNDSDGWWYGYSEQSPLERGTLLQLSQGLDIVADLLEFGQSAPAIDTEYDLVISLTTFSARSPWQDGQPAGSCGTHFDSSSTAYAGITGIASSTYRYPGFTPGDPGTRVPTPATWPLVLAALGAATAMHRRRPTPSPRGR